MPPFFSVIIPTYNSENFIIETLDSVMNQSYKNFEIIISDDGSTDQTIDKIEEIFNHHHFVNNKIIINKHKGPGNARNKAIHNSSGHWVSFLDSDDLWRFDKLEKVFRMIQTDNNINYLEYLC